MLSLLPLKFQSFGNVGVTGLKRCWAQTTGPGGQRRCASVIHPCTYGDASQEASGEATVCVHDASQEGTAGRVSTITICVRCSRRPRVSCFSFSGDFSGKMLLSGGHGPWLTSLVLRGSFAAFLTISFTSFTTIVSLNGFFSWSRASKLQSYMSLCIKRTGAAASRSCDPLEFTSIPHVAEKRTHISYGGVEFGGVCIAAGVRKNWE